MFVILKLLIFRHLNITTVIVRRMSLQARQGQTQTLAIQAVCYLSVSNSVTGCDIHRWKGRLCSFNHLFWFGLIQDYKGPCGEDSTAVQNIKNTI